MEEEKRQYNESLKLQQAELQLQKDKFAYEKEQNEKKVVPIGNGDGSGGTAKKKGTTGNGWISTGAGRKSTTKVSEKASNSSGNSAYDYLNALIASGATKDKVSNEISIARVKGEITDKEAKELRNAFTPRGVQY